MQKLCFAVVVMVVLFSSCSKKYAIDPLPGDTTPPSFSYPFLSFASTHLFVPFGGTLANSQTNKGYEVTLSDTTQQVLSASYGVVGAVSTNPDGTYAVAVKFKSNSIYTMLYSGLGTALVQTNDNVSPGTILGKMGGTGTIDFYVIKNNTEVVCPQNFGSVGFNNAIQQAIDKHNQFHPTDSVLTPCLVSILPN